MSNPTIRQIVRQGQDTLARILREPTLVANEAVVVSLAPLHSYWVSEYPPIQYPQSLGELCLEAVADATRRCVITFCPYPVGLTDEARSHIHALRRAMYFRPENHRRIP